MPGLVDTHSHAAMTLFDGLGQNENLSSWLTTMSGYESRLSSSDVYTGSQLATDEMIKNGITTFNDMYFFPEQTTNAATQSGMRMVTRIPSQDNNGQINFDQSIVQANQKNPLITYSVAPNPLLNYSVSELKQFSDYALKNNYLVHIHFEEDPSARTDAQAKYGLDPLQLIEQGGFLKNKIVLAHSVDLNSDEISKISQYPNIGISFNPISEFNLSTPLTPASSMLDKNITVGFGTDGEPSGGLDMFAQMKFAANGYLNCTNLEKFCKDGKTIKPEKIVQMATIDGAKILDLDSEIGSLEVGKQADIIVLNAKPGNDVYSQLVYNIDGSSTEDSIIGGKVVMEDKKVLTLNESEVINNAKLIMDRFKK